MDTTQAPAYNGLTSARYDARDLVRHYTAFRRWFDYCDVISAEAKAAVADLPRLPADEWLAVYSAAQAKAIAAYGKAPAMPPKARKYRMYDAAYNVLLFMGGPMNERPSDMAGVAALIERAKGFGLL